MSVSLIDLIRTDFRTSKAADDVNTRFQRLLGLTSRYGPARLAIGVSLSVDKPPVYDPERFDDLGKAIRGENLFGTGTDLATWIALIVEQSQAQELSKRDIQHAVAAHWERGINLLWEAWKGCGNDFDKFLIHVLERSGLKEDGGSVVTLPGLGGATAGQDVAPVPIVLTIGDPSTDLATNEQVSWHMNGRGVSPHMALMGTLGSGKTRTALHMIKQIKETSPHTAFLLFDMGKGDLASDTELARALGATVISVPSQPVPLDVLRLIDSSEDSITRAALQFRDSFARVSRSRPGGNQLDALREAAKNALRRNEQVTLADVRDALKDLYRQAKRKDDVVVSTFNDLCSYRLFSPDMGPDEFLSRSWIIDLHSVDETTQRLIAFLVFDAAHNYLNKQLPDASIDADGNRALRLAVVIDEARRVLGTEHESLIELVRLSRSKGGSVIFITQSPDDFAQEEENFLENIGLAVSFRTNAKSGALKAVLGENVDLGDLASGVCVTRLPDRRGVIRVKTWE